MGKRILVITGGDTGGASSEMPPSAVYDFVIAADSGLDRARELQIRPDIVIGDLDSASPAALEKARGDGIAVDAHPAEKEHTDFELALQLAIQQGASDIAVIGGAGGRPDHWLANLGLLGHAARAGITVSAHMGGWTIAVAVPGFPYCEDHRPGDLVSLLPIGGDAAGVVTSGLDYPLADEDLTWESSRGVSNVSRGGPVRVDVKAGTLLVMRPNVSTSSQPEEGA